MNLTQRLSYLGGAFSLGIYGAFNNYTMALWLSTYTNSYALISLLGNSRSLEGSVVSPLMGFISDHTWLGWLGRRRPFILIGGLTSGALIAATPTISHLPLLAALGLAPATAQLLLIVVTIVLFTFTFNMADDIHKALRADLVQDAELNVLSALSTTVELATQVALLVLGFLIWTNSIPDSAFVLVGALVAVGVMATVLGVKEQPPEVWRERIREPDTTTGERLPLRAFLQTYRGAFMFCLVSLAYWSGVNAVLPLLTIYVRDILGTTEGEAQLLPGLLLLSTMLMAIPAGWLATRFGKKLVLGAGYAIMAAGAVVGLLITTKEQGMALFFVAGLGNAATVLSIPIMADLVPRQHMGVGTGLLAGAGSIAAPAASIVAGGLSQIYGPRVIFAVMAVMVVVAIVLLPTVKPPEAIMVPKRPTAEPAPEPEPSGAETPPLPIPPIEPSGD
jgi:Na+/melibiose symporter-like transporter